MDSFEDRGSTPLASKLLIIGRLPSGMAYLTTKLTTCPRVLRFHSLLCANVTAQYSYGSMCLCLRQRKPLGAQCFMAIPNRRDAWHIGYMKIQSGKSRPSDIVAAGDGCQCPFPYLGLYRITPDDKFAIGRTISLARWLTSPIDPGNTWLEVGGQWMSELRRRANAIKHAKQRSPEDYDLLTTLVTIYANAQLV